MKLKRLLVLLIAVSTVIISCKKTAKISNSIDYKEYVEAYPSQEISVSSDFKLLLNKSFDASLITNDLFEIKPKIEGEVVANENYVAFIPKNKLEAQKEYTVTVHLSKLYKDIPEKLSEFTFKVKTKELLFTVAMQAQQMYDKNWNYIEGIINASDIIETNKLPKILEAEYEGKPIGIKFETTEKYASRIHFKIDSIKRYADDKPLKVSWKGNAINSKTSGERTYYIVGKNNFKIIDVSVIDGENQRIEISFSDILKKNQNLKGLIQLSNTPKNRFTYKVKGNNVIIYPSATIKSKFNLTVFKGVKNSEGYGLKENYNTSLFFEQLKPSVKFVKSGTILPNSNNLKINFYAANLRAVDVTVFKIFKDNVLQFLQTNSLSSKTNLRYVGRPISHYTMNLGNQGLQLDKTNAFAVDLADLVTVEEGAMYRVQFSFKKKYSVYSCGGQVSKEKIEFGKKDVNSDGFNSPAYYNDYYYDDYNEYGEYRWDEKEDPCKDSFYYNKMISTNILATNLGVIVKKGSNNSLFVAVNDILTTKPEANATVTIYNLQKQVVQTVKTNADGIAEIENAQQAYFAVVSKNKNITYVRLDEGLVLSMSKFDVSGTKLQKGIKGFIYGERGVWRPGDDIYLTFVLNDNANPIPDKHPIKFELFNPQGKIINREILYKNPSNLYSYVTKTDIDALTGDWRVKITVGGAVFNKNLKIETIKPNRLKIKLKTDKDVIKSDENISGNIQVKWLHGAIAKNLKYDINAKFRQTHTTFKKYKDYHFDDITRSFGTEELTIKEGRLNERGEATFFTSAELRSKAPGKLKASFITKVYEEGGDFSTDVFSKEVSPYKTYVGIKPPVEEQSRNYLFTDKNYNFEVITVNEKGEGVPINNVRVDVYKLEWRWWWRNANDGLSYYDGSTYHSPYITKKIQTTSSGKGIFSINVDENDWGRYLVKVADRRGRHVTSKVVYFDWPSWYQKRKEGKNADAAMLVFTTDKEEYKTKETATVKFPSSIGGRALLTVENGTEVLDSYWIETQHKQTTFDLPILETYAPNVFINISLLQEHSQTVNDLPIRMYGSVPILVTNPKTKLEPQITMDDELKPESTIEIGVSEKQGKPMSYTVALVDEGLLDLTRFKTPNPWSTFYAKQSLGVKTWDIYDDIIGAYGGKINQILSIGGDEAEAGSKNKKANRFKPMVTYLGPFTLEAGKKATHEIEIPKYVGSVRAMVVASNTQNDAYGSTEKTAFVRKPVMVLASLPRKITPNETVTLPVTVFAMKSNIRNVSVSVQENEAFTIEGDKTQNIRFTEPDEKMAYFTLKINDFKGIGKVDIEAKSGFETASYSVEIDVINPNPVTTEVSELVLQGNDRKEAYFEQFGTKGTNAGTIEFSTLPPMTFTKRLQYLIQYPHGCVEQTTSSAFPQLYLNDIFDLQESKRKSIDRNIKATIERLSKFQTTDGGLAYWQGNSSSDDWGTSYAGHFMIEAAKKGYVLPIGFKDSWISYQKQKAKQWRKTSYRGGLAQAYRLYTLALAKSPDLASMNRLRETPGISDIVKLRLATAYALIGKTTIANSILKNVSINDLKMNHYYWYGSEERNQAMALETYSLIGNQLKAVKLAETIAENLSSQKWMSTQTTAYSLLAISKYATNNGSSEGIHINYTINGKDNTLNTSKALAVVELDNLKENNKLIIKNTANGMCYARIYNTGVLPVGKEKVIRNNLLGAIEFESKNGDRIDPEQLTQGTNFVAKIIITNTTHERKENIALTQILPSGWEIINTRYTDYGNSQSSSVDYTDIKDDRVHYYFSLNSRQTKKFKILLNASYLGEYYLPGIQCEAMYDNDYIVRTNGKWVKVIK